MLNVNVNEENINKLVSYYLMASFLYYEMDISIMHDYKFDAMCRRLHNEYDYITHVHKSLIDRESLLASTGYTLRYTNLIKDAAMAWYNNIKGKSIII